jgi:hypothetical protein
MRSTDASFSRGTLVTVLPNAAAARVDRAKIVDYLLDPARSRGKAAFFRRFGFSPEHWTVMRDALVRHGSTGELSSTMVTPFGVRFSIDGLLATPDGRAPLVRTVWIAETDGAPRLITAHPI